MKRVLSIAIALALILSVIPLSGCSVTPIEDGGEASGGADGSLGG